MGRASKAKGLRVINYSPLLCPTQPESVLKFYDFTTVPLQDDLSCCSKIYEDRLQIQDINIPIQQEQEDFPDFSAEELEYLGSMMAEVEVTSVIPTSAQDESRSDEMAKYPKYVLNICKDDIVSKCYFDSAVTDEQRAFNTVLESLAEETFTYFTRTVCKKFEDFILEDIPSLQKDTNVTTEPKHWTSFYGQCNMYMTSNDYKLTCSKLFAVPHTSDVTQAMYSVCYNICVYLRENLLAHYVSLTVHPPSDPGSKRQFSEGLTDAGRGTVRYVGGFCMARLKRKENKKLYAAMKKSDSTSRSLYADCSMKLDLLDSAIRSSNQIEAESEDPGSLGQIKQRQNIKQGLTNISDLSQSFFMALCIKTNKMCTETNLHKYGQMLHEHIVNTLVSDNNLYNLWNEQFSTPVQTLHSSHAVGQQEDSDFIRVQAIFDLYKEAILLFTRVSMKQFRKDYLTELKVEKQKAHRKKIMERKKTSTVTKVSITSIQADSSAKKLASHCTLKALVLIDAGETLKTFTIVNLRILCSAYGVKIASKDNKSVIIDNLSKKITSCDSIPYPGVFTGEPIVDTPTVEPHTGAMEVDSVPSTSGHQKIATHGFSAENPPEEGQVEHHEVTCAEELVIQGTEGETSSGRSRRSVRHKTATRTTSKRKRKRISKTVVEEAGEQYTCSICGALYNEEEDWIGCDGCDEWLHRQCAGLEDEQLWELYSKPDSSFNCPVCDT